MSNNEVKPTDEKAPYSTSWDFGTKDYHFRFTMRSNAFNQVIAVYLIFSIPLGFLSGFAHWVIIPFLIGSSVILALVVYTFIRHPEKLTSEEHIETIHRQAQLGGTRDSGLHPIEGEELYEVDEAKPLPAPRKKTTKAEPVLEKKGAA
jgi:hypothetical protein